MKLLIQPEQGPAVLLKAINGAKRSIELVIFRFDRRDVEKALGAAVSRGVSVQALIAHTNKAGESKLRNLEMRLLAAGVTVSRTADDFTRYHGKMMIVDRTDLYVLAFNFTSLDMERSRSFGVITRNPALVREAVKLFEADSQRHPYEAALSSLVVSPSNARRELGAFLKGARRELLIYDLEISDPEMLRILDARAKAGIEIRVIGKVKQSRNGIEARKLSRRLHTRTVIRDGVSAFIGSQSLRQMELDQRREVGIIFRDKKIVASLAKTFNEDWKAAAQTAAAHDTVEVCLPSEKVVKRVAKAVTKGLPPLGPMIENLIHEMSASKSGIVLDPKEVVASVKDAVKEALKDAVNEAVGEAVEQGESGAAKP